MKERERDSTTVRHGSLEIDENPGLERILWKAQAVGRIIAVCILLLGLAGGFGGGYLSSGTATAPQWAIRYQRVSYSNSRDTYEVTVNREAIPSDTFSLWISNDTLARMDLHQIVPAPTRTKLAPDRTFFEFESAASSGTLALFILFESKKAGVQTANLGFEDGSPLKITQLFLP